MLSKINLKSHFCWASLPLAILAAFYILTGVKVGYIFLAGAVVTGLLCLFFRKRK